MAQVNRAGPVSCNGHCLVPRPSGWFRRTLPTAMLPVAAIAGFVTVGASLASVAPGVPGCATAGLLVGQRTSATLIGERLGRDSASQCLPGLRREGSAGSKAGLAAVCLGVIGSTMPGRFSVRHRMSVRQLTQGEPAIRREHGQPAFTLYRSWIHKMASGVRSTNDYARFTNAFLPGRAAVARIRSLPLIGRFAQKTSAGRVDFSCATPRACGQQTAGGVAGNRPACGSVCRSR